MFLSSCLTFIDALIEGLLPVKLFTTTELILSLFFYMILVSAAGTPIHDPNSAPILSNPTTRHPNAQYIQQQQHQPQQQQQQMFVSFTPQPYQQQQSVRSVFFYNALLHILNLRVNRIESMKLIYTFSFSLGTLSESRLYLNAC